MLGPGPARVWAALELHGALESAEHGWQTAEHAFSLAERTCEAWHALLLPTKHHGDSDWLGRHRVGPVFAPTALGGAAATADPVAVTTAAGYTDDSPVDADRVRDFCARIVALRAQIHGTRGLVFAHNISNLDDAGVTPQALLSELRTARSIG